MIKLFKYLKPYWKMIVVTSIILLIQVVVNLLVPNLLSDMIRCIDPTLGNKAIGQILAKGGIALLAVLGVIICQISTSYFSSKIAMGFGRDVRSAVFKKTQRVALNEFYSISTSSLINRTTNDITQVQQVILMAFRVMLNAPIILIGGCIMAFSLDTQLPFVIIAIIPVLILLFVIVGKLIIPLFKVMQTNVDSLTTVTRENLTGVRVIRAFNTEEQENARFARVNDEVSRVNKKANIIMSVNMPTVELIFSICIVLLLYFGAIKGTSVADITALVQYGTRIMMGCIMMVMMFITIPRASASAKRINEILELPETILSEDSTKEYKTGTYQGKLEFKDVTFQFAGAETPTLKDLSFEVEPGQTLAIIGGTGSGKSTIINLIPRFYDVTSGQILLDNIDLRDYEPKQLRSHIALASQSVELFGGTIKENLLYANPNATDEDIEWATKIACADDFIKAKPDGYNYMIQKGAGNLSGGQKQRLNIARALLKKPCVYIFDDSFSALDFKTDATIRKNIKENVKDATIIIVAQRVNTIQNADKIIVLNDGKMVGCGNHEELMNSCPEYQEIVDSQTKHKRVKKEVE
ncbi:MAG: ABC transporter ATP-binding protein [Eubacteriales bacterium]|nr:ABC transporter ATP-binding protein [Eubacteriales bacterium]